MDSLYIDRRGKVEGIKSIVDIVRIETISKVSLRKLKLRIIESLMKTIHYDEWNALQLMLNTNGRNPY